MDRGSEGALPAKDGAERSTISERLVMMDGDKK
jgi:hypothetical protein